MPYISIPSLNTILITIFTILIAFFLFHNRVSPLLLRWFTQIRVDSLFLLSARGIEWRAHQGDVIPTLRVEKAGWTWGGMKGDVTGLIVLRIEGVSFRIKNQVFDQGQKVKEAVQTKPPGRFPAIRNRIIGLILQLMIHHYPVLTRILSVQLVNCRIIFDDINGLEITLKETGFGVKVDFQKAAEINSLTDPVSSSYPEVSCRRDHPLYALSSCISPVMSREDSNFSPSMSPTAMTPIRIGTPSLSPPGTPIVHSSFTFPSTASPVVLPSPKTHKRSYSRLSNARRQASVFQSRMSSTASKIWTRATGRMTGSVSLNVYLHTMRIIEPQESPSSSRRSSTFDLKVPKSPFRRAFRPRSPPAYAFPLPESGVDTLVALDDQSTLKLSLGFGPRKGLLGEDTLSTAFELGNLKTTAKAVERLQKLAGSQKTQKQEKIVERKPKERWSSHGIERIILRAMQSAKVSFEHITLLHYLSSPANSTTRPISLSSSISSLDALSSSPEDRYTIALELSQLSCTLKAADSSNNDRARNAFGTNLSPESMVRGVSVQLGWTNIALQCMAPGESTDEKSQLFAIRSAEIEGFSSWRPSGWHREELLFAGDPNLALVIGHAKIASMDLAADLQLCHELEIASRFTHPQEAEPPTPPKQQDKATPACLPPRIRMVLDHGPIMAVLADRVSTDTTTLTFELDGCHLGCFTTFDDISARRRDRSASKAAFKEEEELQERRNQNLDADYAMHPAMLPTALRRKLTANNAMLRDDFSISMKGETQISVEPIRVNMTLSGDKVYELGEIGRIHATINGDILGRHLMLSDGTETASLEWSSLSSEVDVGVQEAYVELWQKEVLCALVTLGEAHQQRPRAELIQKAKKRTILDMIPSGISARLSLGKLHFFMGVKDPNPGCHLALNRGIWFQTSLVTEYAYYKNASQALPWRHVLTKPKRAKLKLPEDITTQSLAFAAQYRLAGGKAALISINTEDMYIQPIYNGERFIKKHGGTRRNVIPKDQPQARMGDGFIGWGFQKAGKDQSVSKGDFSNSIPPLELRDIDQAQRPWLRVPSSKTLITTQQHEAEAVVAFNVSAKAESPALISDLSHAYCNLIVALAIQRLVNAWKRSPLEGSRAIRETKEPLNISFELSIANFTAHFAFPLKDQLYLSMYGINITKQPRKGLVMSTEQLLLHVPSPCVIGSWEELGRIKQFAIAVSDPGLPVVISPRIQSIRIRIPFSYKLNSLLLNISVTVKALKLLYQSISGKVPFRTVSRPAAEQPKHVPNLSISIGYMSLEAKDDPVETSLNLIWRVGIAEQTKRNALEDNFAKKLLLISDPDAEPKKQDEMAPSGGKALPILTKQFTVSPERARWALDMVHSQSWVRRIRAAKHEQARRETLALQPMHGGQATMKLPINVVTSSRTAPLFRAAFNNVNIVVTDPGMKRQSIIEYMGKVSSPFADDTEFSLMVPLHIKWTMSEAKCTLRDYPLPLIRVQKVEESETQPAFTMETIMIVAEELADDDSVVFVPVTTVPEGCGHKDAAAFTMQIAKTLMPVKQYAEPKFRIASKKTTEFTWGNSYQPAIQDFMRVVETLSHPPKDPSPRIGFWDKFRLVLHWKLTVDYVGSCHLHLKGSFDPYMVSGLGAGFCLAWRGGTQLLIAQPNADGETIQIIANELIVAIPDLNPFHDGAAIGNARNHRMTDYQDRTHDLEILDDSDRALLERRYTKPCARFVNGVKVGFGFALEKTCRAWSCPNGCGDTDNLLHRQCRSFEFLPHQDVILRSPEAAARDEKRLGRKSDSYEGFRSDFVHFSVSLTARNQDSFAIIKEESPEKVNSLHFAPKASHHFLQWWKLFSHQMSLPVRRGTLYPDSPPPSKKFGRSLGTLKYRFDLKPLYISHMYSQVDENHSVNGKSDSIGIKSRFGWFRADIHQRAQEKIERHELLGRSTVVVHKPFYAADIFADDINVKGIRAHFSEKNLEEDIGPIDALPRVSELPADFKHWYNYLDYIDVDRKPTDKDPRIEMVDFGDCPHLIYTKRVKVRASTSHDDASHALGVESSKFGHEPTHQCYLGTAKGDDEIQKYLALKRISEIQGESTKERSRDKVGMSNRIRILEKHIQELEEDERCEGEETLDHHFDENTFSKELNIDDAFEDTIHVHNPRLFMANGSRNIGLKYLYMVADRKKEEYFASYASLRSLLDSFRQRLDRKQQTGINGEGMTDEEQIPQQLLGALAAWLAEKHPQNSFRYMDGTEEASFQPLLGLPETCDVKPKTHVLIYKPQIALRSESDPNAIVLMSVDDVSFKQYKVTDKHALDDVMADVLTRNYMSMHGLQAFYPSAEALTRERTQAGIPRGLDFIPLEIFLDVKSEATDYDRVLQKSNISVSIDKFNHIRMPRGLEWPIDALDEFGEPIKHLRIHQDLTSIVAPRLTVTANSRNFEALYVVVTDLLLYEDPDHKRRSEQVDDFTRTFDAADRDVRRLVADIRSLQVHVRNLTELQLGYESNFEKLDDAGKEEIFKIRSELQEAFESMYTVNALVRATLAKDDARAAMKTASKMEVRIGGIAWHMLRESRLETMAKVDISGVLFTMLNNKNGTTDNAMVAGDLKALNGKINTLYPEIIVRDEPGKKKPNKPFAAIYWSTSPSIGGIPIFPEVNIEFINIRFKLEEKLGLEVMDYFFTDRTRRRQLSGTAVKPANGGITGSTTPTSSVFRGNGMTSMDDLGGKDNYASVSELGSLTRSKSQVSLISQAERGAQKKNNQDTTEMRLRASTNKMFGTIRLQGMGLNLSYKSDDNRRHSGFTMPDCVDFKFKAPNMEYVNRVWGMEDIFEHIKRDIKGSAWTQSGDIISQLFKKTSLFRSKERLKHAASVTAMTDRAQKGKLSRGNPSRSEPPISSSDIRQALETVRASPDPDRELIQVLTRALSQEGSSVRSMDRTSSRTTNRGLSSSPNVHIISGGNSSVRSDSGVHSIREHQSPYGQALGTADEPAEGDERGGKLKGLFGKLNPKRLIVDPPREGRSSEDSTTRSSPR